MITFFRKMFWYVKLSYVFFFLSLRCRIIS